MRRDRGRLTTSASFVDGRTTNTSFRLCTGEGDSKATKAQSDTSATASANPIPGLMAGTRPKMSAPSLGQRPAPPISPIIEKRFTAVPLLDQLDKSWARQQSGQKTAV